VLTVDNDGKITLGVTSGTGLVADGSTLAIDFTDYPGLEVVDDGSNTGLRVKVDDGLALSSSGLSVNVESPESALEFTSPSSGGYRFFRLHIKGQAKETTSGFPDTTFGYVGMAEWRLALSSGGANLMTDTTKIWGSDVLASWSPSELLDGNLAEGNGWVASWAGDGDDEYVTYDFGAGNRANPSWLAITGYPSPNTSAAYRSAGWILLEGSNDGANWTTVYENTDLAAWTDTELADPRLLRWINIGSGGETGTVVGVKVDSTSPLKKVTDGLTLKLGDGLETGAAVISGPVGRWALDETSGTNAPDSSTNSNDGTLEGSFAGGSGSGWDTDDPGISLVSGSLDFAGASNGVSLGEPAAIEFDFDADEFTIMCWYKHHVASAGGIFLARANSSTIAFQFLFQPVTFDPGVIVGGTNVTADYSDFDLLNPKDTNWHHMAVVNYNDSGTLKFRLYLDGYLVSDDNTSGSTQLTGYDWMVGCRRNTTNSDFQYGYNGNICDVRFYDSALTGEQIGAIVGDNETDSVQPVQADLADTNPALEFDSSGGLRAKVTSPISRGSSGIGLNLASDPGLEDSSGLRVKIPADGGLARDSSGLSVVVGPGLEIDGSNQVTVDLATDPGLEFNSDDLRVKIKTDGGVVRDSDGLSIAAATTTVRGGVLKAAARTDSSQNAVTLTSTTDPADTPADADALRDDLVANVLPTYASRDGELETAVETLAGEFNDLLSKLRTAGVLNT
jgi:hypothetical protein